MVLKPEENIVQQELDRFYQFSTQNKFVISKSKCYTMVFTTSRKYGFPPEFTLGDSEFLEERQEATILGVRISSSLSWESQVQSMVAKATKNCVDSQEDESPGCGHSYPHPVLEG